MLTLRGVADAGRAARVRRHARRAAARRAAATQEDAWQRAVELLFERLAVRWTIAGAPIERQRELLARYRAATPDERAWVREVLREHCAEHFPDVRRPKPGSSGIAEQLQTRAVRDAGRRRSARSRG